MKKLLLLSLFVVGVMGSSTAGLVTVVPYSIDPATKRVVVLFGYSGDSKSTISPGIKHSYGDRVAAGVWSLPQACNVFSWIDSLDFAAEMFNQKTLYCFARAVIDDYPGSPKSSPKEPTAGYSSFIVEGASDLDDYAELEGRRECQPEGAYSAVDSMKKNFDDDIKGFMQSQWRDAPALDVHDNYYYFLRVPFIPAQFLVAKRGYVQTVFPGEVEITFGDFEPASRVAGELGADFENFAWVDARALVTTLNTLGTKPGGRRCLVHTPGPKYFELDHQQMRLLSEDAGVIDAIAHAVEHA